MFSESNKHAKNETKAASKTKAHSITKYFWAMSARQASVLELLFNFCHGFQMLRMLFLCIYHLGICDRIRRDVLPGKQSRSVHTWVCCLQPGNFLSADDGRTLLSLNTPHNWTLAGDIWSRWTGSFCIQLGDIVSRFFSGWANDLEVSLILAKDSAFTLHKCLKLFSAGLQPGVPLTSYLQRFYINVLNEQKHFVQKLSLSLNFVSSLL